MNLAEFHFLRPWWFLALLPAALILMMLIKHRQSRGSWLEVCDAELLPFLLVDKPIKQNRSGLLAGGLVSILTITALAGPTWQRLPSPAFRSDAALVIALDLSSSMDAADIKPSRIAKARYKIADLLKQRKDGQTALLVYGGDAFTVTPLTSDIATITSQLEALTTDIMPSPGTNTGIAIRRAVDLLQQAGVGHGNILLVTDGVDADSAALADKWLGNHRLSVLAVGTSEGAPIQQTGGGFVKDAKGSIVISRLDAATLSNLAQTGKGIYQAVTAGDEDIDRLGQAFNSVNPEDKTQDINQLLQQWDETGPWLLLLVLPWAALRFRKGILVFAGLCLLPLPRESQAFDWQSLWQNPDQRAEQAFKQQQYQQAAEQFQTPDWRAAALYKAGQYQQAAEILKNPQTADEHYNRGNALAQSGQLQEAVQAYQQALKLNPGHQDAQYNKDLVEKKLKEKQQQQKQQPNQQQNSEDQKDQQENKNQEQQQSDPQSAQQQKDQQNQQSQSVAEQKPAESKPAEQQDKQAAEEKAKSAEEKSKAEAEKAKQAQAESKPEKPDKGDEQTAAEPQSASEIEKKELERTNQQLLKRIPDEPTGLLKRKFKYQYSQRGNAAQTGPHW